MDPSIEDLKAQAEWIGFAGADIAKCVITAQNQAREHRANERAEKARAVEGEHELKLARMKVATSKPCDDNKVKTLDLF